MSIVVYMEDDARQEWAEVTLPTVKVVCPRCHGEGTHTNPSIGAITSDEWANDWDDDERAGYLSGRYDVTCEECHGSNVVDVVDAERCSPELLAAYEAQEREMSNLRAMEAQERAYGC